MEVSVIGGWPLRAVLLALLVAAAVACGRVRRTGPRIGFAGAVVVLAVLNVLAFEGRPGQEAAPPASLDLSHVPANGVLTSIVIPGNVSGFPARPAEVYLPPAWFARPQPRLPVLLLLHGTPGEPHDWADGGGATATLDHWAATHGGTTPIVVMPDINGSRDADTECVDSPRGDAETYLFRDVPSFVTGRFGTQAPGPYWAVSGLSEGGSCAAMLALRHPGQFGTFADYGGLAGPRTGDDNALGDTIPSLFGNSLERFHDHEPSWLLTHGRFPELAGWFEVGDADPEPLAAARALAPLTTAAGIRTQLVVVPGGEHDFSVWRKAFEESLPWLAARMAP